MREQEIQLRLEIWKLESALAASIPCQVRLLPHKFVPSKFVDKLTFSPVVINQKLGFTKLGASKMGAFRVENLRRTTILLGLCNLTLMFLGGLMVAVLFQHCDRNQVLIPISLVSLASIFKMLTMLSTGIAQEATAKTIMDQSRNDQARYTRWVWWSRVAMVVTILQLGSGVFLLFNAMDYISNHQPTTLCILGIFSILCSSLRTEYLWV
ncbi:hypothetical protein LINGRAHAP2_LOCUS7071 [Linum grandiflorum]